MVTEMVFDVLKHNVWFVLIDGQPGMKPGSWSGNFIGMVNEAQRLIRDGDARVMVRFWRRSAVAPVSFFGVNARGLSLYQGDPRTTEP